MQDDGRANRRIVVIGGDAAGMTAASQARRMPSLADAEIVVFERGPRTSWAACGLPYFVEGLITDADRLIARTPEQAAERGITVHVHHEVTAIDLATRTVAVRDLRGGGDRTEPWDDLVIATGATGVRPPLPGIAADGVVELRTVDDGLDLDARIRAGARHAVVVGAGYIGIEVAEALLARGLEVSVVEMADTPMAATLDPDMAALVGDAMSAAGIHLRCGEAVEGFVEQDGRLRAVRTPNGEIQADVAVLGLGVRPNSRLAAEAGLEVGASGGLRVDDRMATAAEGVWAAGDCVESLHRITGGHLVVALGTHANKQGRVLGANLGGSDARFPGVIGTAVTKFRDTEIGRTGVTGAEATAAGLDTISSVSDSRTRAGYYPGAERVRTKLVVRRDGVLVGAQVVGGTGAGKRIDALALAVWNEMHVADLAMADLSYAPPFSPVWDPVVHAASTAVRALHD